MPKVRKLGSFFVLATVLAISTSGFLAAYRTMQLGKDDPAGAAQIFILVGILAAAVIIYALLRYRSGRVSARRLLVEVRERSSQDLYAVTRLRSLPEAIKAIEPAALNRLNPWSTALVAVVQRDGLELWDRTAKGAHRVVRVPMAQCEEATTAYTATGFSRLRSVRIRVNGKRDETFLDLVPVQIGQSSMRPADDESFSRLHEALIGLTSRGRRVGA